MSNRSLAFFNMLEIFLTMLMLGMAVASLLLLWFNTDAFVEYIRLLHLGGFLHIDEFVEAAVDDPAATYPEFMVARYPNFFTKLVSCPKCLTFWLAAAVLTPIFGILAVLYSPVVLILFVPVMLMLVYSGLSLYYILVKLMHT